jgi:hypothetical protein
MFSSQLFKGSVSGDGYLFESLNTLISTFSVCADEFQGLSIAFTSQYNYKLFICFFEILTNFENAY